MLLQFGAFELPSMIRMIVISVTQNQKTSQNKHEAA
jgi:hypothetical protein